MKRFTIGLILGLMLGSYGGWSGHSMVVKSPLGWVIK